MFLLDEIGSFLFVFSIAYVLFGIGKFAINFFFNDDFKSVETTVYDKVIYLSLISYILNYIIF